MKRLLSSLALLLALLSGPLAAQGGPSLRIGTEAGYAPYIFRDPQGQLAGMDVDLAAEICRRGPFTCAWVEAMMEDLMPGLAAGRFDVVIAGIGDAPDRRASALFTEVYVPASNTSAFAGFLDARGPEEARIAVQAGTIHEDWLAARGLRFASYPTNEAALAAVEAGQADLFLGSSGYIAAMIERRVTRLMLLYAADVPAAGASIAVARGQPALLARLNDILAQMEADGTLPALRARWFASGLAL